MSKELHIASLVVQVLPQKMADVRQYIMTIENAELSVNNDVKLVVVLEGDSQHALMSNIEKINDIPGVLSATMVYHQNEMLQEGEE